MKRDETNPMRASPFVVTLLSAMVVACTAGPDDLGSPEPTPARGFAMCASVLLPNSSTNLLFRVDDLGPGTLDLTEGVEIGGGGATCNAAFGAAFTGTAQDHVLTRYDATGEGEFVEGGRVSFLNEGITSIFSGRSHFLKFLSETRALYLDRTTGTVVVWDPSEMTVISSLQLEGYDRESVSLRFANARVEGALLLYGRTNGVSFGADDHETVLIFLDPETLAYDVQIEERCGGFHNDVQTADGTIYFASSTFIAGAEVVGATDAGVESCMLRILPGQTTFDDTFYVAMNGLAGGQSVGGFLPAGPDGALVYAYDPGIVDPAGLFTGFDAVNAASWRVLLIDDLNAFDAARELPDFPLQTGSFNELNEIGGRRYVLRADPERLRTIVQDVTDPENVIDGLIVEQGLVGAARPLDTGP